MRARHEDHFLMDRLILNCDLGEDEPTVQTEALLLLVDAANICCGFHAGNPEKTRRTIELALKYGVHIGAHPGIAIQGGRGIELPSPEAFHALLTEQIGAFQDHARSLGASVEYVKLHGSLYHAVEQYSSLAEVYIKFLLAQSPRLAVYALAGGSFAQMAATVGLRVFHEVFADRAYRGDGALLPRSEEGSVLTHQAAVGRFKVWIEQGTMPTLGGQFVHLKGDTLCVHGDSPDALEMTRELRSLIQAIQ